MDDTSPYVRELKKQHAAELAKQEAWIAELERERDEYAHAALVVLSGAGIPTPEKGYVADGGSVQMAADIRQLRDKSKEYERLQTMFDEVCDQRDAAFSRNAELAAEREQIIEAIAPGNKDTLLGKYLRESTENIVAHLSEQRKGQDELIRELTADLKTHMHLVRTMGERCDLLGGLLREVLNVEKQIGPNDTVVGPNVKLKEKIERALAQGEPEHDE